jgi:hypothetical protein
MPSPRAFSGASRSREPFDWPLFFRTFHCQPVPVWLLLSALAAPAARAFPALSRAACQGRLRESLAAAALIVYMVLVPPLLTAAYYLAFGRRRLVPRDHRLIADATFALLLILSLVQGAAMVARVRARWDTLRPGLAAVRAACWP